MSSGGRLNRQAELLDKPVAYRTGYSIHRMFWLESIAVGAGLAQMAGLG
jgi:hypothetical protein